MEQVIPLIFILMTHKSYQLYCDIFLYIKNLLEKYSIKIDFSKIKIKIDFEKASRKAIKTIFPDANLRGFYFHFIITLWNKARKKILIKKIKNINTHILIFAFKLYQFIQEKEKDNYVDEIKKLYKDKSEYKNCINYFVKNYSKCNFLNF